VDFHAVTGPGGGVVATDAAPGESKGFSFRALKQGLYVYHCAVPLAAHHIANGMYGLILVEPEEGLPPVDREFYVMQGEVYTSQTYGSKGKLTESLEKLLAEAPEYYVFNRAANALTGSNALTARVGETIRIYFGIGRPNKTSSFHVIGEIFDKAYQLASLTTEPLADVQTITVPPGGAAVVDMSLDVPGEYVLVDHALSRVARGLVGKLVVDGVNQPALFKAASVKTEESEHNRHSSIDPPADRGVGQRGDCLAKAAMGDLPRSSAFFTISTALQSLPTHSIREIRELNALGRNFHGTGRFSEKQWLLKMSPPNAFAKVCSVIMLVLMVAFANHSGPVAFSDAAHQCKVGPSHHPQGRVADNCCHSTQCVWVFSVLPVLPDTFAFEHGPQFVGIQRPFVITRSLYPPPKPGLG
jgi:FtsP/CotA-like multicopper oxidase with cupredoxin domain